MESEPSVDCGLWERVTPAAAAPLVKDDPHAGVTQNWDKNLPSASRFTVLTDFAGKAVRDNDTGLVWEQAPGAIPYTWEIALSICANANVPNVKPPVSTVVGGWRLPSVIELKSLHDLSLRAPFVPGSVFTGLTTENYWSATTSAVDPNNAWLVKFSDGYVTTIAKTNTYLVWCVRGGMNADQY